MTLRELIDEVSDLGYDGRLEVSSPVLGSLNRSLRRIYGERNITGDYSFLATGERPTMRLLSFTHEGGKREALPLSGAAYSFYVSGNGRFKIMSNGGVYRSEEFSTDSRRFFGLLPDGGAELILDGQYTFGVFKLSTYSSVRGSGSDDIPDGSEIRVLNLRELLPDFLSFSGHPRDRLDRPISEIKLMDGRVYYPEKLNGEVKIRYRKLPPKITGADPNEVINVPEDCLSALVLLTASDVFYDANPDLAERYAKLYDEYMKGESNRYNRSYDVKYRDTDGWA